MRYLKADFNLSQIVKNRIKCSGCFMIISRIAAAPLP